MNELAPINPAQHMTVSDVERVATAIAKGGLFGSKDPNAVLTLCLLAQAEGQHPAVVFRDYHIISGRPAKKADAMLRDFINAGGKVEWHQLDDTCADATFTHPSGSARISWDHDRAQKAQLGGNAMYKKYPRQMLRSRVISEGVRTVFPGATSGLYEQGEVEAMVEEDRSPMVDATATEVIDVGGDYRGPAGGKTKLRNCARDFRLALQKVSSLDDLKKVWAENRALRAQLHHQWPALLNGVNEDDIGIIGEKEEAKARVTMSTELQWLLSSLDTVEDASELRDWQDEHNPKVEKLSDAEQARLSDRFNDKEKAFAAVATVTAGA